jgi:hypothetical protein
MVSLSMVVSALHGTAVAALKTKYNAVLIVYPNAVKVVPFSPAVSQADCQAGLANLQFVRAALSMSSLSRTRSQSWLGMLLAAFEFAP